MSENKRIFKYDFLRVVFMCMVLLLHISCKINYFSKPYNVSWYAFNITRYFLLICNPLFFMLSGKFNLNKKFEKKEDYINYYKNKFLTIVLPFILISFLVYMVDYKSISIYKFVLMFLSDSINYSYWFIYTLIWLLFFSPFFAKIMQNMTKEDKKIFFIICCIADVFVTILTFSNIKNAIGRNAMLSWQFYYLLGYFIDEIFDDPKQYKFIYAFGILAFVVQCLLGRLTNIPLRSYNMLTNPSIILTLEACTLYIFLSNHCNFKNNSVKKSISFIAKYSYVFYLLHAPVLNIVIRKFNVRVNPINNICIAITVFIIIFVFCLASSYCLTKLIIGPLQKLLKKDINLKNKNNENKTY